MKDAQRWVLVWVPVWVPPREPGDGGKAVVPSGMDEDRTAFYTGGRSEQLVLSSEF